ncbi:MAG: F0F1 ATP synthase subunit delta [Alphaproteobacteria bacterium]|nr:F0F1 ATP synthase subunit delta [Alphaproteobacteria bacterium]
MKTGHQDIARRYGLAFFELAKEQGQIEQISLDLQSLKRMLAESGDFERFINNITMSRDGQAEALAAIGDKAKFTALTQKFLGTLAKKRRLNALPEIITAIQDKISFHQGEVTAHVVAAHALEPAQVSGIAAALKKVLGMTVKVELKQDAGIMGGLIIKIGSQQIDSSVRAKLERLHRALKSSNTSSDKTKMREVA